MTQVLTALAWVAGEMVFVILEVVALKGHQTQDCGLLGLVGDLVVIEGLRAEGGGCLGCSAFSFGGGIVTGL
jgi:hypothetical protein